MHKYVISNRELLLCFSRACWQCLGKLCSLNEVKVKMSQRAQNRSAVRHRSMVSGCGCRQRRAHQAEAADSQLSCWPPHWQQISTAHTGSAAWKCQKCHSKSIQLIRSPLHKDCSTRPQRNKDMSYTSKYFTEVLKQKINFILKMT